jgi:predicted  nucleic acid-binding Zn-ribbon protein
MDEMQEKNKELERPKDLGEDTPEQMEDIQEDLEDSKEDIQQQKNNSASKKQDSASKKMKKMAQSMQSSMQSEGMDQMKEDIAALRQLLENLVTLSFDQEDLVDNLKRTHINTPTYVSRIQDQFKLKDDFQLIQDSLQELAKRVSEIESFVTEKVVEVKSNLEKSIDQLEERQKDLAADNQRRTMKNVNDLALMLSEAMQQMQQQMSGMMQGTQMCNKPGGAGSSGIRRSPMFLSCSSFLPVYEG